MPLYEVTLTCNASVSNSYRVEADSEEEAIEKARTGDYRSTYEEVLPDRETDAEAYLVEPAPPGPPAGRADGEGVGTP